jgi:hypothetical protein
MKNPNNIEFSKKNEEKFQLLIDKNKKKETIIDISPNRLVNTVKRPERREEKLL